MSCIPIKSILNKFSGKRYAQGEDFYLTLSDLVEIENSRFKDAYAEASISLYFASPKKLVKTFKLKVFKIRLNSDHKASLIIGGKFIGVAWEKANAPQNLWVLENLKLLKDDLFDEKLSGFMPMEFI